MQTEKPRTYRARWAVLFAYSLVTLTLQLEWLTFAPVASEARAVYGVGAFEIDLLSLIFMAVFILTCIPASWVIDRFGLRVGVGLGAALTGIFGLVKGLGAESYATVAAAQVGLAVAQPLVINAVTKLAASWFPIEERATAVGLATLAQFIGIIVAMVLTPGLVDRTSTGWDLQGMLLTYGVAAAVAAALGLALIREKPPTPPGTEVAAERLLTWSGIRHMFRQRDMLLLTLVFFIGLGTFNALSTCIDQLCADKHLDTEETGLVGGMMLITGVVGALIWPILSDRRRRRKPFLVLALAATAPALAGLYLLDGFVPLVIASGVLGFFLLGAGAPIGFQYAAEVSYPAAESRSQGLILLAGQVSGIVFIVGINTLGIMPLMVVFIALALLATALALSLRESPRILSA